MEAREIVQALLDAGLTQTEIAKRTGMAQGTVSKVLAGHIKDVRSRSHSTLSELLKLVKRRAKSKKAAA